jgi:hypothetical protein
MHRKEREMLRQLSSALAQDPSLSLVVRPDVPQAG